MSKYYCTRAGKAIDASVNEDAVVAKQSLIAVSDGAGGCGIFADRWSAYLLDKLEAKPFASFEDFDAWTIAIWQEFFDTINEDLPKYKPMVATKFHNEGSYATLAAAWLEGKSLSWTYYGDSALFVYRPSTGVMELMTCRDLSVFAKNPNLINWKTEPKAKHYYDGDLELQGGDIVIVASDALSCLIACAYSAKQNTVALKAIAEGTNRLAGFASAIEEWAEDNEFYTDLLLPLVNTKGNSGAFTKLVHQYYDIGILDNDDYSMAWIEYQNEDGKSFNALSKNAGWVTKRLLDRLTKWLKIYYKKTKK